MLASGQPVEIPEYAVDTPEGQRYRRLLKVPWKDEDGTINGVISWSEDITERKKLRQERDDAFQVITSSINYASRIQRAILPAQELIEKKTKDYFVLWRPRDVVGGDIYWCHNWGLGTLLILGDCTGHGVPGAFMTLISSGALDMAIMEVPPGDSAGLISRLHQLIQVTLGQDRKNANSDDGLELGVCYLDPKKRKMVFAGAGFPLYVSDGQDIEIIKGDRKGIGYIRTPKNQKYTNQDLELNEDHTYYMTSDGLIDQLGGKTRRSFGKKRFKELLLSLKEVPLHEQGEKIYEALLKYQGTEKRRDDVSVIGFKV